MKYYPPRERNTKNPLFQYYPNLEDMYEINHNDSKVLIPHTARVQTYGVDLPVAGGHGGGSPGETHGGNDLPPGIINVISLATWDNK